MNILIGKRSNLSTKLSGTISDAVIISADNLLQTLDDYIQNDIQNFNIVFDNFQSLVDLYSDINYGIFQKTVLNIRNSI